MAINDFTQEELQNEEWRDVVGLEGYYHISTLGRVKRIKGGKGATAGRILSPFNNGHKYLVVSLYGDGEKFMHTPIHIMVGRAFLGERPDGLVTNHKDGIKHNNRVENLEYVTIAENILHSWAAGLHSSRRGTRNANSKLTKNEVIEIRNRYAAGGCTQRGLAKEYGVSYGNMGFILREETWTHIL